MICLKLKWFFYGLSRMLQFSQFVWTPCYSVWDVFNNFLLIDATDRSKISSDWKRFFIALSLYPLSFFANTPFKDTKNVNHYTIIGKHTELFIYAPCSSAVIWNQRRFYDVFSSPCFFEKEAGPLDLGYRGQCHTTIGSR